MKRIALITNNTVTNIIVAEQSFLDNTELECCVIEDNADVDIGYIYNGDGTFFKNDKKEPVPKLVTRRQALQQLIKEGLDDDVLAVINSIPDTMTKKLMTVWYNDSQVFERDRPEILQVWSALGRTSEQLDATFIAASKL